MTWLTPPDRLTAAQAAAIKAPTTVPVVLRGGPGAGKTVVLLHRAHHLRHALGPQAKIVVLVYTNVLRDFIRSAVTELRLALAALGEITGDTATPDLLTEIFSRFCLGK